MRVALFGVGIALVATLSGCVERPCADGEHPVHPTDSWDTMTCVKNGQPAPSGWATFDPGHTPTTAGAIDPTDRVAR